MKLVLIFKVCVCVCVILLAASTLVEAVGLSDRRVVHEAWVSCVAGLQRVQLLLLMSCGHHTHTYTRYTASLHLRWLVPLFDEHKMPTDVLYSHV